MMPVRLLPSVCGISAKKAAISSGAVSPVSAKILMPTATPVMRLPMSEKIWVMMSQ